MMLRLYEHDNRPEDIQRIVDLLEDGGVIVYPTDTLYAIACSAMKERSIERICRIKSLDVKKHRLSIICSDLHMASVYTRFDDRVFKVLKRNLPGPFTFILDAGPRLPRVFRNRKEVGVRIPDLPLVQEIVSRLGHPLMSASVPHDEEMDPGEYTDPFLIQEHLEDQVDLIVYTAEGGTEPSTIVDCRDDSMEIIRQGLGWLDE